MPVANSACSCQVRRPVSITMQSISFWIKHPSTQIADLPKVSKVGDDSLGETAVTGGVSLTRPIVFLHGVGWGLVSFLMLLTMHLILYVNAQLGFVMSKSIVNALVFALYDLAQSGHHNTRLRGGGCFTCKQTVIKVILLCCRACLFCACQQLLLFMYLLAMPTCLLFCLTCTWA